MPLIKTTNLNKTYCSSGIETHAVQDVSFEVNEGEFVAIMGPSGSGKSTLLHILGFLDRQTSGEYFFGGKVIDDYTNEELAHIRNKKMGFVFQSFNLLPRTSVLRNVLLPLFYSGVKESLWEEMAMNAIREVGLSHRINHDSATLSGGEKQRAAIARALVNKPNIIFADEPTGNLDSDSGEMIMDIVQNLHEKRGHTIMLITHEEYIAEHAERVIKIQDGRIVHDEKVKNRVSHHKKA